MIARPDEMVRRAEVATGLTDWGMDGWQEGLDQLVRAVDTDLAGDDYAERLIEAQVYDRLALRLRIEELYASRVNGPPPAPVEAPIVIVGLPRTATTAAHYLLANDPGLRYLRGWEVKQPLPPPNLATEATDSRRNVEVTAGVQHIKTVDGPVEDGPIHGLHFHAETGLPLPTYMKWWRAASHRTAFAYHERFLQLLHWERPPHRWVLKYPNYGYQLDDIFDQYPDATFVVTHRDPTVLIPSTCSVMVSSRRQRIPHWSPDESFGQEMLSHFAGAMRRLHESRVRIGEHRFLDIGQPELERDAVTTAERIYEFVGLPLTATVRTTIADWAAENQRGSRGAHTYSAEDYGLTTEQIREAFADYLRDYGGFCE